MNDADVLRQILVLETGEIVRGVGATDVDLEGGHPDGAVGMSEKVVQDVEDGRLRHDQLLQVLRVEVVAVDVDGRQEDRLHLIVTQLVRRLVRRDQHLNHIETVH